VKFYCQRCNSKDFYGVLNRFSQIPNLHIVKFSPGFESKSQYARAVAGSFISRLVVILNAELVRATEGVSNFWFW